MDISNQSLFQHTSIDISITFVSLAIYLYLVVSHYFHTIKFCRNNSYCLCRSISYINVATFPTLYVATTTLPLVKGFNCGGGPAAHMGLSGPPVKIQHVNMVIGLYLTFLQYSRISTLSVLQVALWSKSVAHLPLVVMYWLWYSLWSLSPCFSGQIMAT